VVLYTYNLNIISQEEILFLADKNVTSPESKKKGKNRLIIIVLIVILAVIVGVGTYFLLNSSDQTKAEDQSEQTAPEEEKSESSEYNIAPQLQFTPFMDKLSDSNKKMYREMRSALFSYKPYTVDLLNSSYTEDDFQNVFDALCMDNPILELYVATEYTLDDDYSTASVIPVLSILYNDVDDSQFDPELIDAYIADINAVCDDIISRMPQDASLSEKYEFLGREISYMTEYAHDDMRYNSYTEEYSVCRLDGVLLYGKSVCVSYSQAYQYLCNRAGLWCIVTEGFAGEGHAWNMVMLEDGLTYHVDLTWADIDDDDYYSDYFYNYFLLTQEEIEIDHVHEDKDEWCATGV